MELTLEHGREQKLPLRTLLHTMALAREGDRREGILLRQGQGWFQVSGMGHEALAAVAWTLQPDDYIFPYYRDRALVLARGVSSYALALAYFARQASSSGGRQMPGHYSDRKQNIFSVATPTASQCLPAAGAAWAAKLEGSHRVVVTSVGDAACRQGEFYEAAAFALQENLPIVFLMEDNRYGISTPTEHFFPWSVGVLNPAIVQRVNARDPELVFEAARSAVKKARQGKGPSFLWCELDRLCSHSSSDDQRVYRSAEEIALDLARDPLDILAARLIERGEMTAEEWDEERELLAQQIDEEYCAAAQEEAADPGAVTDHLFGPSVPLSAPPVRFSEPANMVAAINQTLHAALTANQRVLLCGEDIEDPKGGVFGLTKGLSRQFPGRVFNAPLAEATIAGVAVGMAACGWKPVFEIQFIDFLCPAFNQLMSQVSSLRWRTQGEWNCPLVFLAPSGAYLPGGSLWHSESSEGIWAHIHGLQVMEPSTPEDAAGLLWSAIQGSDPTLILLPKHIFRKRMQVPETFEAVPPGKAAVRRIGTDVTLVAWGNCMELAEEAAARMEEEGVSVEVLDLRTLHPFDSATIELSLAKTGRLVVVHEDSRTASLGQAIVAEMTSHPERWNLFFAPPQIVARLDVPIGFHPALEFAALPSLEQVLAALRTVME